MLKQESRIGVIKHPGKKIYDFLGDMRHYEKLIPEGKLKSWSAEADHCRFSLEGLGEAGLKIVEKKEGELIKFAGDGPYNVDFFFWIQIRELKEADSRIRLTLKADLNPMMLAMAKAPLKKFMNMMVDYLENLSYD